MDLSKATGKIKAIWKRLSNPDYREAYVAGKVANEVAFQVFYLREHRGWTQGELARRADTQQPAISRLERSIGSVNVGTLLKIARAFNVGLSIRFVPFSKLVAEGAGDELSAPIPDFEHDCAPLPIEHAYCVGTSSLNLISLHRSEPTSTWLIGDIVPKSAPEHLLITRSATPFNEVRYVN